MAVYDTRVKHYTPGFAGYERSFERIAKAARIARLGVQQQDVSVLAVGVQMSYQLQLEEGMQPLPDIGKCLAHKYCGGGHGGYALYLFESKADRDAAVDECEDMYPVEPYCRTFGKDEQVAWEPRFLERLKKRGVIK